MGSPQSEIYLCSGVRLNSRYEHSIYFDSLDAQQEYFMGKAVRHLTAYSFLRKSWSIKINGTMENSKTLNYLFFRNRESGKFYYYFINNIEYVNDSTVELFLELDVIQTYFFDFDLLPCFVERQHVDSDGVGENTIDEGLEMGHYTENSRHDLDAITAENGYCILVASTITLNGTSAATTVDSFAGMYSNVFSGLSVWAISPGDWAKWSNQLENLSDWGKIDGIVSMWMYPKALVTLGGENTWSDGVLAKVVSDVKPLTHSTSKPSTVDGYKPKNNKLFCYPYSYLYMTNNEGNAATLRYERFTGNPSFNVRGSIDPKGGVHVYPTNYNGASEAWDEGLTVGAFPTCAWDSDTYKVWLAQNENQQNLALTNGKIGVAAGAVAGVASAVTGNIAGAVGGIATAAHGANQIAGIMAQRQDMAVVPPQACGTFSSSVNTANHKHTVTFINRCITAEFARTIDEYFNMYGYKINRVKVPNIKARKAYTYIKTIGCHVAANMCNEDTVKIESIFDNGITFWRNGDSVGNYYLDNTL